MAGSFFSALTGSFNKIISGSQITGSITVLPDGGTPLIAGKNITVFAKSIVGLDGENYTQIHLTGSAGGGGISWDGATANGVATFKDAETATVEANFTFDGTNALIADAGKLQFRDTGIFLHSNTDGQFTLSSDGADGDAINITTANAAGGIDIDAGTGGVDIDTTGNIEITGSLGVAVHTPGQMNLSASLASLAVTNASISMTGSDGQIYLQRASTYGSSAAAHSILMNGNGKTELKASNLLMTGSESIGIRATGSSNGNPTIKIQANGSGGGIALTGGQGGLTVDTTGPLDFDTSYNNASAVTIGTNGGASERITLTNVQGESDAAISLTSSAGGITLKVADEKNLTVGNAAGDAYFLVAASNTAGNEDLRIINTNGTDDKAIEIRAAEGGISIECADEKSVYIGNDAADAYVMVAASATANNEDIRLVNTNGENAKAIEILASAGGVSIECADEKEAYIGNDAANTFVKVRASATATSEDILLSNAVNTNNALILSGVAGSTNVAHPRSATKALFINSGSSESGNAIQYDSVNGNHPQAAINIAGVDHRVFHLAMEEYSHDESQTIDYVAGAATNFVGGEWKISVRWNEAGQDIGYSMFSTNIVAWSLTAATNGRKIQAGSVINAETRASTHSGSDTPALEVKFDRDGATAATQADLKVTLKNNNSSSLLNVSVTVERILHKNNWSNN